MQHKATLTRFSAHHRRLHLDLHGGGEGGGRRELPADQLPKGLGRHGYVPARPIARVRL